MSISVITVCYNSAATIADTIKSVLSQNYQNLEHIIIDGGSTDGTVNVIEEYRDRIACFVSEPDNGIYDAMNKGIQHASGDIIGILNSDDFYAEDNVLEEISETFETQDIDCCYGDLEYVHYSNIEKVVRRWKSSSYRPGLFRTGWHPPHPTFFVKRDTYQKYGLFDLELDISADYEIMLRFLEKEHLKSYYIPRVLVKMRNGGASNRNIKQIIKANLQCCRAWKKNGFKVSLITAIRKPMSKFLQFG